MQFLLITSLLLWLMYIYSNDSVRETFAMQMPEFKKIELGEYQAKLFSLPSQVQDLLMPKLAHLESAYTQDTKDKRNEEQAIDDTNYLQNKDAYVCDIAPDGTATINKDKLLLLHQEYRIVDDMLKVVKTIDVASWDKITEFNPDKASSQE